MSMTTSTPASASGGNRPAGKSLAEIRGMGKTVAREAGGATVQQFFEANKAAIAAVLPKHMTADRMLKIALRCLRTTPKLMGCTLDSLFGAVVTAAQLGLEPNTPQGHIYFIPFENRKKGTVEVQVIIGYKGLIDLARRSGEIESISSRVVYEQDEFEIEFGTEDRIVHRPFLDGDPGQARGFYAVAKLKGGGTQFEWMSRAGVDMIRDGSQGYMTAKRYPKNGVVVSPWVQNYDEMGRKTAIRRLAKYLPMSIELAGAVSLDERGESGMQNMGAVLDGIDYTVVEQEQDGDEPEQENSVGQDTDTSKQQTRQPPAESTQPRQSETAQIAHEKVETANFVQTEKREPATEERREPVQENHTAPQQQQDEPGPITSRRRGRGNSTPTLLDQGDEGGFGSGE